MSTPPREPNEEEMRAAYEAELKRISVSDVVVQTAVSLINLAGRRLGLAAGAEDERDLEQVRDAIDAARGLMPVLERRAGPDLGPLRDALSQLQMAYAREAQGASGQPVGQPPGAGPTDQAPPVSPPGAPPRSPGQPEPGSGPAQSSGRLWVPGR